MESLSNSMLLGGAGLTNTRTYQQQDQSIVQDTQSRILKKLFNDLSQIRDPKSWVSNYYPEHEAYCILHCNQIYFYFLQESKIISVALPTTIEIPSAQNLFLYKLPQQMGLSGYLCLAFGLDNFAVLHLDEQYTLPTQGYALLNLQEFQNIQAQNQRGCLSIVRPVAAEIKTLPRTNILVSEYSFYLGAASQQKLVLFKVQLMKESSENDLSSSVTTQFEETVVHQEAKTLTSRLSSFISQKLGFRLLDNNEASQCVKDVHFNGEGYATIVTNKDVIIIRRRDNFKVYEREFIESARQADNQRMEAQRDIVMRDVLQFRIISSDVIYTENEIKINLLILKNQVVQYSQSYQAFQQTSIIHQVRTIDITGDVKEYQDIFNNYEDKSIETQEYVQSFHLQTQKLDDIQCHFFLEFSNNVFFVIEYSAKENLVNINSLSLKGKLLGYNSYLTARDQLLTLISTEDIQTYAISYTSLDSFNQLQPLSLKQSSRIPRTEAVQAPPLAHQPSSIRLIHRPELKQHIFRFLDAISRYLYPQVSGQRAVTMSQQERELLKMQTLAQIEQEIRNSMSQVTANDYLNEVKTIIRESIDQQINESHFSQQSQNNEDIQSLFQDGGLILNCLENKIKKLEVIMEFLEQTRLIDPMDKNREYDYRIMLSQAYANLRAGYQLRLHQESIKDSFVKQGNRSFNDATLTIRLLNSCIKISAEKLGYTQQVLASKGVTSLNVIFSNLSQIEVVFNTLCDILLDAKLHQYIQLKPTEDVNVLLMAGCEVIQTVIETITDKYDTQKYFFEQTFLGSPQLADQFFRITQIIQEQVGKQEQQKSDQQVNNPMKQLLLKFDKFVLKLYGVVGLENTQEYKLRTNSIVVDIEKKVGIEYAIDFAREFNAFELLCRLVYDAGKRYYQILHDYISNHGEEYLQIAFQQIYGIERAMIRTSIVARENIKTFDSQNYKGFKMFDMFEQRYSNELIQFMEVTNKRLFSILLLRFRQSNAAHQLFKEILPVTKFTDTTRAISSLALTNANCTDMDKSQIEGDYRYFEAKLELANTKAIQTQKELEIGEITTDYLDKSLKVISQEKNLQLLGVFQKLHDLIEAASVAQDSFNQIDLPKLKEYFWTQVMKADQNNLSKLQSMLPSIESNEIFTEYQIKEDALSTLVYQLADRSRQGPLVLNREWRTHLTSTYTEQIRALNLIFSLLDNSYSMDILFSGQYLQRQEEEQQMFGSDSDIYGRDPGYGQQQQQMSLFGSQQI